MWLLDKLYEMMVTAIANFLNAFIVEFSKLIDNVFTLASQVVKGDVITKLTKYTTGLALALLLFLAVSQIIKLFVLNEDSDPDSNIVAYFIRLGKTIILMSFSTYITTSLVQFSDFVANDVRRVLSGNVSVSTVFSKDITNIINFAFGKAMVFLLILTISLIALIIITVQAGLRGVNLAILQVVAPLTSVNYITTDKGLWKKWLQKLMSVSLTYVFQMAFMNIGLTFMANGITNSLTNSLIGLCWLLACIKVPSFLDEFAYSTGVGGGMSKSVSIAQTVTMLSRR